MWSRILAIFAGGPLRRYVGGATRRRPLLRCRPGQPRGALADRPRRQIGLGSSSPSKAILRLCRRTRSDTHVLTALKKKGD